MKLIISERGLSPLGLKIFLEKNNKFVEFGGYKIVISSYRDFFKGFKWYNVKVYKYTK